MTFEKQDVNGSDEESQVCKSAANGLIDVDAVVVGNIN